MSSSTWQTFAMDSFSDLFIAEYDLIPNQSSMNGVTGILVNTATDYPDLSCIVRLNSDGYIDVYNTNSYLYDQVIAYETGDTFHVQMIIDTPNETYDVYIIKNSESEVLLANDYGFRKSTGVLDSWAIKSETGNHMVQNMSFHTDGLAVNQEIISQNIHLNPTYNNDGIFYLSMPNNDYENVKIQLLDIRGNELEKIALNQNSSTNNFYLTKYSTLPSGVYLIIIKYNNKTIPFKVVKYN